MSEHGDTTTPPRRLPDFQSRKEMAKFWDTHSFADYLDDLELARVHIADDVTAPRRGALSAGYSPTEPAPLPGPKSATGDQGEAVTVQRNWLP